MESLPPTLFNKKLVDAISQRAQSELFSANAKKWFWFAAAASMIFLIMCCAAYVVTVAYFNFNKKDDFSILAKSFEEGFKDLVLKAETSGTVNLMSDPLKLRDGQSLQLDPKATVSIAKGAEVIIKGEIPISLPETKVSTPSQMTTRNSIAASSAYFTVFKSVPYKEGQIQTGWKYLTSNQEKPSFQYCYYYEDISDDGSSASFEFASDGQIYSSLNPPQGFDLRDAFRRCIWHEAN
jgi:hypothetical protein